MDRSMISITDWQSECSTQVEGAGCSGGLGEGGLERGPSQPGSV